jgi:hypothetical protein
MNRLIKTLLLLAALLVLGAFLGTGAAQASRGIELSSTTIGASGVITLNGVVTCDVLISITANSRTISKTTGITQATVNGGWVRNCTGSLVGSPSTGAFLGPIDIEYASFSGTLPNITRITVTLANGASSLNTVAGNCLYGGRVTGVGFDVTAGTLSGIDFNGSSAVSKVSGSILCPSTRTAAGRLTTFIPATPTLTLV